MAYESNDKKNDSVYSQRVRAGKRRTYFFDVRETRGNDFYLTITESRKRFNEDGYDRHKIFLYKEDFNKFLKGITEAIDFVKTELMPDFDFDVFSHEQDEMQQETKSSSDSSEAAPEAETESSSAADTGESSDDASSGSPEDGSSQQDEQADKW